MAVSANKGSIIMAMLPSLSSLQPCVERHKPPELEPFCSRQAPANQRYSQSLDESDARRSDVLM